MERRLAAASSRPVQGGFAMKHEGELVGRDWLERDPRIQVIYDVTVHGPAGGIEAELVNVSSDGFRLRCSEPLETGWEVTLEVARHDPLKALIVWACGLEAGGVFAEPVAL
jgi:hypothetical protein